MRYLFLTLCTALLFGSAYQLKAQDFGTWDLGIHTGLYLPSNQQAAFYNGAEKNDNKISFILDNKYHYQDIMNTLNASDTFLLDALPGDMKYNPAFQIGLYFRRTFDNYSGLSLQFNYSKLTASDKITIEVDPNTIASQSDLRLFDIWGIEERVNIDLLYSKYFRSANPSLIPFMEAGINLTSTRVQENVFRIRDREYSMVNTLLNQSYVPGAQQTQYTVQQGGVGMGFAVGGGIRITHNNLVSIDPGVMLYLQRVNLEPYDTYNFAAVFFVRLSLANFFGQADYE